MRWWGLGAAVRELTPAQAEVVRYIAEREMRGELPPTHRDMCAHFGVTTNAIGDRIKGCVRKGYVHKDDLLSRGLHLTRSARVWLGPPVPPSVDRERIRESARRLVASIGATIDRDAAEELAFVALLHERIAGLSSIGRAGA